VHLPYPHPQPLIYIPRTKHNIGFIRPTQAITALTHIHISHTTCTPHLWRWLYASGHPNTKENP